MIKTKLAKPSETSQSQWAHSTAVRCAGCKGFVFLTGLQLTQKEDGCGFTQPAKPIESMMYSYSGKLDALLSSAKHRFQHSC